MIQNTNMQIKIMMMRMMINIKKVVITFIVVDLALIFLSLYMGNNWLISSQSAFFASILVTLASFLGYKKMIEKKIALGDIPKEDRDDIEIIEDRHDLYTKEEDFKTIIKEERAKITNIKTTAQNLGKSLGGAMSIFRLLAYGVLFLSFLYLNRHGMLNIAAYLVGLAVVPLVALGSMLFKEVKE